MPQSILNPYILVPSSVEPDPSLLVDCILWYRADKDVTLGGSPAVDAGAIDSWGDQIGSSDALQGTAAWRPTYHTGVLNGLPIVRFAGTPITSNFAQHLRISNATCPAEFTSINSGDYGIIVCYKPADFTFQHYFLLKTPTPPGHVNSQIPGLQVQASSGHIAIHTGTNVAVSSDGPTVGNWHTFGIVRKSSATNGMFYFLDGTIFDSDILLSGAGNNTSDCTLGARGDGTTLGDTGAAGMRGDLAEMLVYDANLDSTKVAALHAYLAAKYAL